IGPFRLSGQWGSSVCLDRRAIPGNRLIFRTHDRRHPDCESGLIEEPHCVGTGSEECGYPFIKHFTEEGPRCSTRLWISSTEARQLRSRRSAGSAASSPSRKSV